MIGRKRAVTGRKRGPAEIGKLFGMKLDGQAGLPGRIEDAGDLGGLKGNAFAESVDRIHQAFPMGGAERRDADFVDIAVRVAAALGGYGMGAEKAGDDGHGAQAGKSPR